MKPTLQNRINQQLIITPPLQHAIRVLQLSTLKLQKAIQVLIKKTIQIENALRSIIDSILTNFLNNQGCPSLIELLQNTGRLQGYPF